MPNIIKALIQNFLNTLESLMKTPTDIKPCSCETIYLEPYSNQTPTFETLKMLQNPDLLIASLEDAKVISDNFCSIKISNTLSQVFSLITLLNPTDLIITDDEGKFSGIVSSLSVFLEFTPPLQNVPFKYKNKMIKIDQASEFIIRKGKKMIGEIFSMDKNYCFFQKRKQVDYALDEFCKLYRAPDDQSLIPILNDDQTIRGVVTCKGILEYLKNDRLLDESKVENLLEKLSSTETYLAHSYTLLPEETLESALYAINYLPIEYILICSGINAFLNQKYANDILNRTVVTHTENDCLHDAMYTLEQSFFTHIPITRLGVENLVLGSVDDVAVATLSHKLLFDDLIEYPLGQMMNKVSDKNTVDPNCSIRKLIGKFVDGHERPTAILVGDFDENNQFIMAGIISYVDIFRKLLEFIDEGKGNLPEPG